jgi:hypothetical protein
LLPLLEADGEVGSAAARAELLRHLESCVACRGYRDEITRVHDLVRDGSPPALTEDHLVRLSARLAARLAARSAEPRGSSLGNWWHAVEARPLPTLLQTAAVAWVALILLLQVPGVEPGLRLVLGL